MQKDWFKELYECRKKLLNEYLVLKRIKDALSFSGLNFNIEIDELEVDTLREQIMEMEVDLKD